MQTLTFALGAFQPWCFDCKATNKFKHLHFHLGLSSPGILIVRPQTNLNTYISTWGFPALGFWFLSTTNVNTYISTWGFPALEFWFWSPKHVNTWFFSWGFPALRLTHALQHLFDQHPAVARFELIQGPLPAQPGSYYGTSPLACDLLQLHHRPKKIMMFHPKLYLSLSL